jgi:hypothetical protein
VVDIVIAARLEGLAVAAVLDPDVAAAFSSSLAVNTVFGRH